MANKDLREECININNLKADEQPKTLAQYLSSAALREAWHVPSNVTKYFESESSAFNYIPSLEGSSHAYEILYKYGYKMLHIVGDTDGNVPLLSVWKFLRSTAWKISKPWQPYFSRNSI